MKDYLEDREMRTVISDISGVLQGSLLVVPIMLQVYIYKLNTRELEQLRKFVCR